MSISPMPRTTKILVFNLQHLPTEQLSRSIIHCSTIDDVLVQSIKYNACILIIVFASDKLKEVVSILPDISFDALYIMNVDEQVNGSAEGWWLKTTIVHNEKQLMRHLCTKSMLCSYNEGMAHRQNGNVGLANACLWDSLHALDCAKMFV